MEEMRVRRGPTVQEIAGSLGLFLVALALLVLLAVLVWRFFSHLEADTARVWALVATVLFCLATPAAAWAGWWFGKTEARGALAGLDVGVDKVMGAATRAVEVKAHATRRIREAAAEPPSFVVLPPAEPAYTLRRSLPAGEVIDVG